MEQKHKAHIMQRFPEYCKQARIILLDIEDMYQYGNPELVSLLKDALQNYL